MNYMMRLKIYITWAMISFFKSAPLSSKHLGQAVFIKYDNLGTGISSRTIN